MSHYYNEHDTFAAEWLGNLGRQGSIPEGFVDDRDIQQVQPGDVAGYVQCHFFAGIGGWPAALALAGWPNDRPVWTGSCPCQPFSIAGKKRGEADERHLWPEFFRLIRECRPATIFGEQVASPDGLRWLDGVFADLESIDYACGAVDLPAACVKAPHGRQRLCWVADTGHHMQPRTRQGGRLEATERRQSSIDTEPSGLAVGLEHSQGDGREQGRSQSEWRGIASGRLPIGLGNAGGARLAGRSEQSATERAGGNAGDAWSDYRIIKRRDGKYCRINAECRDEPLAYGIPANLGSREPALRIVAKRARRNRVGRLKGYGNAIVPQVAAKFVMAFLEAESALKLN